MSERMPPKRRRTPNERGMTEEEILRDRSGLDPMARYPLATSRDPGYVVGGPQMTDPRHFELMRRNREEARTQGTRLKKGGPVKKYADGGMVEIEIKVGGGGKHKMPDGSMMHDSEMEDAEEYKKGGLMKKKKYAEGGEVDYGPAVPTRRFSRGQGLRSPAASEGRQKEVDDTEARRRPVRSTTRTAREIYNTAKGLSPLFRMGDIPRAIASRANPPVYETGPVEEPPPRRVVNPDGTEEIQNIKKGGMVKAKAPTKKMAKGGATSKNFIQGAIKKPGALRAQMGVKAGQKIPAKKLAAAAKAPGKLGQRARFAQTLAKMKRK